MDFANVSSALSTLSSYDASSVNPGSVAYAVGAAVLGQSLDANEAMGDAMLQMMERSVTPELGGTIDMYI